MLLISRMLLSRILPVRVGLIALPLFVATLICRAAPAPATISATADLGTVTLTFSAPSSDLAGSGNLTPQVYLHDAGSGAWVQASPGGTVPVYPGGDASGSLTCSGVPAATYDQARLILFGPNWQSCLDVTEPISLTVQTTEVRLTGAVMTLGTPAVQADGQLHCPWTITYPAGMSLPASSGVWVMVKGGPVFAQAWAHLDFAQPASDPWQKEMQLSGELDCAAPANGIYNIQGGMFDSSWKSYGAWVYPGATFEVGGASWISRCDASKRPSVEAAFAPAGMCPWSIGGDVGNYSCFGAWGSYGNYGDVGYYRLLAASVGCTWMRENFDPDRYASDQTYRDIIRSHVEAMWQAGIVPVLAPQDEPQGGTIAARDAALTSLDAQIARDYSDAPDSIILEVCNEPHEHPAWSGDWKTEATVALQAMRAADPQGHYWCPLEGLSKSAASAAGDPLRAGACDAYDLHAYLSAGQLVGAVPRDGTAGTSSIPVVVGEYHDTTAAFHQALLRLPNVVGIGAWAWGEAGQDGLALVASQQGAALTLTADGQALSAIYQDLRSGTPMPAPAASGGSGSSGSGPDVSAQIAAALAPILTRLSADEAAIQTLQTGQKGLATAAALAATQKALEGEISRLATEVSILAARK